MPAPIDRHSADYRQVCFEASWTLCERCQRYRWRDDPVCSKCGCDDPVEPWAGADAYAFADSLYAAALAYQDKRGQQRGIKLHKATLLASVLAAIEDGATTVPEVALLAGLCPHVDADTVRNVGRWLADAGVVHITGQRNRQTTYHLVQFDSEPEDSER